MEINEELYDEFEEWYNKHLLKGDLPNLPLPTLIDIWREGKKGVKVRFGRPLHRAD
jgi:hypothetical protein